MSYTVGPREGYLWEVQDIACQRCLIDISLHLSHKLDLPTMKPDPLCKERELNKAEERAESVGHLPSTRPQAARRDDGRKRVR